MKIDVAFLSLQDLPSQDASGIHEAIKKAFTEVWLETCLDKIVFFNFGRCCCKHWIRK